MDRLGLFGQENGAHAALADLLEQLVGTNLRIKIVACGSAEEGVKLPRRRVQKGFFLDMDTKQGFNAPPQFAIFAARLEDVCVTRFGTFHLACGVEDSSLIELGLGHDTLRRGK